MNVYDFDNTIFEGDSTVRFFMFSLKRHPKIFGKAPSIIKAYTRFYLLKKGTKTECKQTMYRFLTCIEDIDAELRDFWTVNEERVKPFYLRQHRSDDVIISASPFFLLFPICKKLGIKHLIASEVDPHTGVYTGENCHGEEKVRRFRECFKNAEIESFYSDSYSDSPMAEIADNAFMVKKDRVTPWIK